MAVARHDKCGSRLVADARTRLLPVKWISSLGHDATARHDALATARNAGQIGYDALERISEEVPREPVPQRVKDLLERINAKAGQKVKEKEIAESERIRARKEELNRQAYGGRHESC